ncbi:uncharacterized protein LOC100883021 isoform X2 [Megachile rotundata]|nr:PREDICTED: uncharacterized protein LOC100883021 isoform X2 [Megachile rotundata]XP_012136531.1 PREDICTED: uncharacterized protein LOC100883021 isoform X2 [Megachile rotundata]XP_012136532.1 PREDICTED: uncharacterized protein LOC100883021 isoform X2 [Megachile rotundata]
MVQERTLKLLKRRVDLLSEQQRKLLAIDISKNYPIPAFFIYDVNTRESKDESEKILDITVAGWQKRNDYIEDKIRMLEEGPIKHIGRNTLTYIYVFRRKYINGTGGPWMAKLISYGNMNTYLQHRL